MIQNTVLANSSQKDFIQNVTYLKSKAFFRKPKNLTSPLILTPLIDVFSILVVYLLLNFSVAKDIPYVSKEIRLPSAKNGIEIEDHMVVKLKMENILLKKMKLLFNNLPKSYQSIN